MAKIRNIAILVLSILLLFGICVMVVGCSYDEQETEDEKEGTFYSLQEAYDRGLLSQENLLSIAYYHNNWIPYTDRLSENIAKSIKRDLTKILEEKDNKPIQAVDCETAIIEKYYGTYNNCVAVIVDRAGVNSGAVYIPISVEIGSVTFIYDLYRPQIVVWKF